VAGERRVQPSTGQRTFDALQLFDVNESFGERVPERLHAGLSTRLSREPEAVRYGSRRRSDVGSHPIDLCRVDTEASCHGAKAHDTQRYVPYPWRPGVTRDRQPRSLWRPRFDPVDSQRRMETYDAARAPSAGRCEEIVFASSR
jgi:hypothetical protein